LASEPINYHWVLEADITACFDEIDHTALMDRLRARISDKRVNVLVKAFLKSGVMTTSGKPGRDLDRDSTGRGQISAAGQHRLDRAGRSFRSAVASDDEHVAAAEPAQAQRPWQLEAHQVR
jgi:hypothetical protein